MKMLGLRCRSRLWCRPWWLGWMLCGLLLCTATARAHLIEAQKGTLKLVGDAALLVLSVPVSALHGVDDNADAALSKAELRAHAESIRAQVLEGVQLLGPGGALPLQLVMVDIALPDAPPSTSPNSAAEQAAVPTASLALDKPAMPSPMPRLPT